MAKNNYGEYIERLINYVAEVSGYPAEALLLTFGREEAHNTTCRLTLAVEGRPLADIFRKISDTAIRSGPVDFVWEAFDQMALAAARYRKGETSREPVTERNFKSMALRARRTPATD